MWLDHLYVNNFKSLVDFELKLVPFTCLIGLNGSGKSTVLHAIHFAARLFSGGMKGWLTQRQWEAADLNSKLPQRSEEPGGKPIRKFIINISLRLHDGQSQIHWQGSFNRVLLRCTQESLMINGLRVLHVEEGHYELVYSIPNDVNRMSQVQGEKVRFAYGGSILSQLKDYEIPESILPFKEFMRQTTSLDPLAPQYLRQRTRQSGGNLGLGGESLSAFVNELSSEHRRELEEQLRRCYPNLNRIYTSSLRGGWKKLEIGETFGNNKIWSEARHINDGMLRLIAILAELLTKNQFLLFGEIENGINPELVEFLLDALVNARQQLLVTTHSPMILNYLDDDDVAPR